MISYPCPGCATRLDGPDDSVGRPIQWPDCNAESTVPGKGNEVITEIRFFCPGCRKSFRAPVQHAGRRVSCESCSSELLIPATVVIATDLPAKVLSRNQVRANGDDAPDEVKWSPALPSLNQRPDDPGRSRSLRQSPSRNSEAIKDEDEESEESDNVAKLQLAYRRGMARRRLLSLRQLRSPTL